MAKLTLCVSVILVLLVTLGESSPKIFCCTRYREHPVRVHTLKYYAIQEDTGYCNMKAAIFKNDKNKFICANPDREWVQQAMEIVPHVK